MVFSLGRICGRREGWQGGWGWGISDLWLCDFAGHVFFAWQDGLGSRGLVR